jgi:hypothetical protein
MYSISAPPLIPIISLLISLILYAGFFKIGKILISRLKLKDIIYQVSDAGFQNILLGCIFTLLFIQPFIIFEFKIPYSIQFFALIIFVFGIIQVINFFKFKISIGYFSLNYKELIFYALLTGLFLLSIAPITNADSLDYHVGVPLYILNNQEFPGFKAWMHYSLSGSGEILNTVGLSIHSEQILSMIQFGGILSVVGILKKISKEYKFFSIFFLSSPVLIFLVSSAKPQLLFIGATSLSFAIVFFSYINNDQSSKSIFKKYIFICFLLATAVSAKFTFILSSGIIALYFLPKLVKTKNYILIIFVPIIIYLITIFPLNLKKYLIYEGYLFNLIYPFPSHLFGYKGLYETITTCGYHGCFPYWIIFPKDLGSFTEALGFGSIVILFAKNKKNKKFLYPFILIISYCLVAFKFGPNQPRWYLEPLIWLLIISAYSGIISGRIKKVLKVVISIQSLACIFAIYYGVVFLSIGSTTFKIRDIVMKDNASGYELYKWANSKLKKDDVLITTHRSNALSNVKTIPGNFLYYIRPDNINSKTYFQEIKKLKPNYILFYEDKKNFDYFKNCLGELEYFKKSAGRQTSRNPIKKSDFFYDGYIYNFNYKKLPNCLFNQ